MKIVHNWHQFVILFTCSDNVCPYLVLVHVFSSLGFFFVQENYIAPLTRATQSMVYPLAYKYDPVTLTLIYDLENQKGSRFSR